MSSARFASRLVCAGCGAEPGPDEPWPFRCPRADEPELRDVDHVLRRELDLSETSFPEDDEPQPFVRFRELLHAWRLARRSGLSDADYVGIVRALDAEVAEVDGAGLRATPYVRDAALSDALGCSADGGVWIKDETGNVAGSHKVRHLFGLALQLEVAERAGLAPRRERGGDGRSGPALAIASCGNAALAAAVVAKAARRPLRTFVPPDADPKVLGRLLDLGAELVACPRSPGDPPGDPCLHRFRAEVRAGALPFTVQGNENGLAVEGGETLAWEIVAAERALGTRPLDRLFVQVGGGALASASCQGFDEAARLGATPGLPRLHAVQTERVAPLARAWKRVADGAARLVEGHGEGTPPADLDDDRLARWLAEHAGSSGIVEQLELAARHRSRFMTPWEEPARSLATGILDDETYDWLAVVHGMLRTGGRPLLVSEERLAEAARRARGATAHPPDETGAAALAGALLLAEHEELGRDERIAVLVTGRRK